MGANRVTAVCLILVGTCVLGGCRKNKLKRSKDVPSVVVRSPDAKADRRTQLEREPNDSLPTAQPIEDPGSFRLMATLASPLKGRLDDDFFRLQVPGTALPCPDGGDPRQYSVRFSVSIESQGAPLLLTIQNSSGKSLANLVSEQGRSSVLPNLAVAPGETYWLRVKRNGRPSKNQASDAGVPRDDYVLLGELGEFSPGDEREPNGSESLSETVTNFVGMTEKAGYASPSQDEDWYRVPLPVIHSVLGLDVAAVDGVALSLKIVDAKGAKLGVATGHRNSQVSLRNVAIPSASPDAGIEESVFAVVRTDFGQNPSDRYVLRLSMGPGESGMEIEPNDDRERANELGTGGVRGYLSRGDTDFFRYKTSPDQGLRVTVTPAPRVRLVVEITRAGDGLTLVREASKSRKEPFILDIPSVGSDLVFVRVSPQKGDGNPNQPYSLVVTGLPREIPSDLP